MLKRHVLTTMLAATACTPSQESVHVLLDVQLDASGIMPTTNDDDWVVELTTVRIAVTDLQFTILGEMHGASASLGGWLISRAWAHPGHYAGGDATGELAGDFILDWTGHDGMKLGTADMLTVGVARQLATLTVTTEDGKSTFNLFAYSRAAGADFFINNTKLTSDAELFKKDFICAGESAITLPVVLNNIGEGTVRITGVEVYDTDTTYPQGVPKYPLRRVGGLLVPTRDYFLRLDPGVAPATGNLSPAYPIETPEAQTSTFYLTFVPQLPGKRFTRMFIYTNAANFTGVDIDGKVREGELVLDMFGRGLGSHPSVENMTTLTSVTMPKTMVGKTSTTTIQPVQHRCLRSLGWPPPVPRVWWRCKRVQNR